jgi:Lrp/AsnC family leucine-responsive transcriptional regulator
MLYSERPFLPIRLDQNEQTDVKLDRTDRAILHALEADARLSFGDLADAVGISKTPCWNRVRALEQARVIAAYRAEIDPAQLGLELHAFVRVTLDSRRHGEFEAAVMRHRSVLECHATTGDGDYLLHVLVAGIAALDGFLRNEVSRMPGVQRLHTTVGTKVIKSGASILDCAGG